jgi:intermediate peptidase
VLVACVLPAQVCAVVDAAELCRQTHPSREWVTEAEAAFVSLSAFVGRLNGHSGLYSALCAAQDAAARGVAAPLSAEGARVAASLRVEFERGGIHLSPDERAKLHALQVDATSAGIAFGRNLSDVAALGALPLPPGVRADMLPPSAAAAVRGGRLTLAPDAVAAVLQWCADARLRRNVHAAAAATPSANRELLLRLLTTRHDAARLLGFESHAAFATAPLLARAPAAPLAFCAQLSAGLRDAARDEMARMAKHRPRDGSGGGGGAGGGDPAAWERPFLMAHARAAACGSGVGRAASQCVPCLHVFVLHARLLGACARLASDCAPDRISLHASACVRLGRYFPLRSAIQGLALLCDRLFGVALTDAPLAPGEAWAPGVRKLAATHPQEGPLGCVYLDLRPRRHKFPGAAHFVIRAGRSGMPGGAPPQLARVALVASLGGMRDGSGGGGGADSDAHALLSHAEVELLFHEAGHALHSLLSRTSYQHLSGTRGAQDVVEAPSTLFERFAWHPAALRAWARHPGSGEAIPEALVGALRAGRDAFAATDALTQLAHAVTDLALHGAAGPPPRTSRDAAALAAAALAAHTPWPAEPAGAAAGEARFGHVVGYGSTYYAYAYGVALSGAAWRALGLDVDPLAPAAGGRLWRHVLRPGGSADPAEAFTALLGQGALRPAGGGWAPDADAALLDVLQPAHAA